MPKFVSVPYKKRHSIYSDDRKTVASAYLGGLGFKRSELHNTFLTAFNAFNENLVESPLIYDRSDGKLRFSKRYYEEDGSVGEDPKLEKMVKLVEGLLVPLGVTVSLTVLKAVCRKALVVLTMESTITLLTEIGSKLMARFITRVMFDLIVREAVSIAMRVVLMEAMSFLSYVGLVVDIVMAAGILYTLWDPRGFNHMMNKEQVDLFVEASNSTLLKDFSESLHGESHLGWPLEITPEQYSPTSIGSTDKEIVETFLSFTAEFVKSMDGKPNARGEVVHFGDEYHKDVPPLPTDPAGWAAIFSEGMSTTVGYTERFLAYTDKLAAVTVLCSSVLLIAALIT